jgi:phosphate transport system protein
VKPIVDIPRISEIALDMLRTSLHAYTASDVHLASSLSDKEEEVDNIYSSVFMEIVGLMGTDRVANRQLVHLLMVAQYLERVADHATNIGEGVIFMVTGKRKDLNP